jgi:hypothetical protein
MPARNALAVMAGLIVVAAGCTNTRSDTAFCETLHSEKTRLSAKYEAQAQAIETAEDPGLALVGSLVMAGGAIGDLVVYTSKLAKVAPDEIQTEAEAVRDSFKSQAEATTGVVSDPLGTLAGSLLNGLMSQGALNDLNDYAMRECGESI